ncbi:hypothetical protein EmuJ_001126600 [Echinococcus multilocularis]|uniref:Uncharacterized protein n=1 Tax=Echinococcus multilocularis TaxID=6211 RepID=A0A068YJT2_ECHMU|nr:hypothetical protein EmuJ_001126600 [Echinococcus multilocularis]
MNSDGAYYCKPSSCCVEIYVEGLASGKVSFPSPLFGLWWRSLFRRVKSILRTGELHRGGRSALRPNEECFRVLDRATECFEE